MRTIIQALVLVCFLTVPLSAKATIENLKCRAALSALTADDRAAREMANDYFQSSLSTSETIRTELISMGIRLIAESYDAFRLFNNAVALRDRKKENGSHDRTTDRELTTNQAQIEVERAYKKLGAVDYNLWAIIEILSSASPLYIRSDKLLDEYLKILSNNIDNTPKLELIQYFSLAPEKRVDIYLRRFPTVSQNQEEAHRMLAIADSLDILHRLPITYSDQLLRNIDSIILRRILVKK